MITYMLKTEDFYSKIYFISIIEPITIDVHSPNAVILNQGRFCPAEGIWQCLENVLGEGNGTHSSTLAWKIPWMEEPGRLRSMGSLRVRHD